ncbi:MAG: zf-HC2 domain-containing protein [Candidatus Krumholzibacteriia bacterium]
MSSRAEERREHRTSGSVEHVRHRLQAYVDGELPESERTAVERHCEGCAGCRAGLAELAALWNRVEAARLPEPTGTPGLWSRVRPGAGGDADHGRSAGRRPDRAGRRSPRLHWGFSGAALAAGVALGLLVGRGGQPAGSESAPDLALFGVESVILSDAEGTLGALWLAAAAGEEDGS